MSTAVAPHRGLPPLAGLCTFEEAARPGLSVEESVRRLKRHHWVFRRLHGILIARLTAEPVYELKMAFSLHAHLCAEHVAALRRRVGEMREPPLGLETVPDAALDLFLQETLCAPTTHELLLGVYEKALPALLAALERHAAETHPLADAPTIRTLRFARLELEDILAWAAKAVPVLVTAEQRVEAAPWLVFLDDCLAAAGGMDGTHAGPEAGVPPAPRHSATPFQYDGTPRRDARFADPYNMGVNAEVFLYDETMPPRPKTLMMYYKRLREIDVPEMMAGILTETPGKPWDYYRDMTRQLWDEARHAMMGEAGFVKLGVDWPRLVRVNFTWSLGLNTQLRPFERHAVLYFIEQGLMPKTGKRFEWEVAQAAGDPLAATFQDFDWADEVLHARIGRDWYLKDFENPKDAIRYGDECWSKVLLGWREWRDRGLTEHANWWPALYDAACAAWGEEPDPRVRQFNTSYEAVRADLQQLAAPA